jgi:hypothetical protein
MRGGGGVSLRNTPLFSFNGVSHIVSTSKAPVALGLLALLALLALLVTMGVHCPDNDSSRSAVPAGFADLSSIQQFQRDASTGLFVGVRKFPHDETLEVPYAVDDAVDLAHRFALDQRVALIPPRRVVLVLSGTPQKEESKERLKELDDAGARIVREASSGDIFQLLQQQATGAGANGLLVLSIASHGFQQNGDAYILGSTSSFGSTETSLRAATIFEAAALATRSLIFIDACRDRIGQNSRGAASDPAAVAPHIRRMKNVKGQVIFYAAAPGAYAFDDHVSRNGVFTRAVLDGLDCQASAPRGTVIVDTLHRFVDDEVRRWIQGHKNRKVAAATQISLEGETRNMPLCNCWLPPGPKIRVAFDGKAIRTYGENTQLLWEKTFDEPIVHAEAADLDADALYEVVVGLRDRIMVFDNKGNERWNRSAESRTLRTFTLGDLYEKHTNQIVALWNDDYGSRLTVLESKGSERSSLDFADRLLRVAVGRPTRMHAPRIVVTTSDSLLVFLPKKLEHGLPAWRQVLHSANPIKSLQILDGNHDTHDDIAISTDRGTTWFTFEGKVLGQSKEKWERAVERKTRTHVSPQSR